MKCDWPNCGEEFEFVPQYTLGSGGGRKTGGSNQAKCPKCGNFMPTR